LLPEIVSRKPHVHPREIDMRSSYRNLLIGAAIAMALIAPGLIH